MSVGVPGGGSTAQPPAEVVAALEAAAQVFHTPSGNGRMVWRRWGDGPPLVLLHGGSGSWTHWIRNIEELARHRTVWLPDMPGYGDSDVPAGEIGFDALSSPIVEGIRSLLPTDAQFDLGGFSMGAHVSLYVARDLEPRVRRHVLVTGHLLGPLIAMPNLLLERWRDIADVEQRAVVLRRNLRVLMLSSDERVDDLAVHLYALDLPRARVRPQRFINTRDDGLIARLRRPVDAIAGELDPIATPSSREQGERLIQLRPESRFKMIEGAGHWVAYEAAAAFNRALLDVLG